MMTVVASMEGGLAGVTSGKDDEFGWRKIASGVMTKMISRGWPMVMASSGGEGDGNW